MVNWYSTVSPTARSVSVGSKSVALVDGNDVSTIDFVSCGEVMVTTAPPVPA